MEWGHVTNPLGSCVEKIGIVWNRRQPWRINSLFWQRNTEGRNKQNTNTCYGIIQDYHLRSWEISKPPPPFQPWKWSGDRWTWGFCCANDGAWVKAEMVKSGLDHWCRNAKFTKINQAAADVSMTWLEYLFKIGNNGNIKIQNEEKESPPPLHLHEAKFLLVSVETTDDNRHGRVEAFHKLCRHIADNLYIVTKTCVDI